MNRILKAALAALILLLGCVPSSQAQGQQYGFSFNANYYNQWRVNVFSGVAAGGTSAILSLSGAVLTNGTVVPFATVAPFSPLTFDLGSSNAETVTPTAVSIAACPTGGYGTCATISVSGGFVNAHAASQSPSVGSGSGGLYEAALAASNAGGGVVIVDGIYTGTATNINNARGNYASVGIYDTRANSATSGASTVLQAIGTGTATASSTLFLLAAGSATNAFTNTTATNATFVANRAGTLRNMLCSASTGGVNASSGVVTVRTAPLSSGTFANTTITATFGTGTAASDSTHTATVTAGQPIQIQVTSQLAETLAGLSCSLQFN